MAIALTRSGKVEGTEDDGILVFRGIPFAAPPVDGLRWQPPQREAAWDDVRDATSFSHQSAQTAFSMTALLGGEPTPNSEDSLYLNVWTPACDDKRRPVMVWIHGGAFVWGGGDTPWYDGTSFARNGDVVIVTINYRLGPFGFMALGELFPDLADSANVGLLDQIAALEWVRDSIAGFGGDPDRVTVFGESAGGGSIGTLLAMPAARGLFHAAIPQSGAASWWSTTERATDIASRVVANLGVAPGDTAALLAKSTREVLDALPDFVEDGNTALPFQPTVDGRSLLEPPLDAIAAGNAAGVRVMSGTNRHEMTMFVMQDPGFAGIDEDAIVRRLTVTCGDRAAEVLASYRDRRPEASAAELWLDLATDGIFRLPMIRLLEAQHAHGPVWSYLFSWESPAFGGILRSTHALEIPFVWDTLDSAGVGMFTGDGPERAELSAVMHRAWIAFAHGHGPGHDGLPEWPAYDLDRRPTMRFDTNCELLHDPDAEDRLVLDAASR
ncbi:MAG: carboxylesterase/lipase family protein [Actinomycetota bacterium]